MAWSLGFCGLFSHARGNGNCQLGMFGTDLSFLCTSFFLVVRTVYYFSGSINVNHHLCGDSYSILVAPVNKHNIITHPGEKRK